MRAALLVALAACSSAPPAAPSEPPRPRAPDPTVDMACVERARTGHLLDELPASASGFTITKAGTNGAHLHRDGRTLTEAEGATLWQAMQQELFTPVGLSMGSSGMYSIYRCDDAAPASCIKLQQWVCQLALDALAERASTTLDKHGLGDVELSIDTVFNEAAGPRCKGECAPQQHYSTKGTFKPHVMRRSLDDGRGTCTGDGDCTGSQSCTAWYLLGGAETAEFRQLARPTWCGCIDDRCTWFTQ